MPSPMTTFGERLKSARKERNLSQQDVAAKIGVVSNTVSRWERDVCPPRGAARKALRRVLPDAFAKDVSLGNDSAPAAA